MTELCDVVELPSSSTRIYTGQLSYRKKTKSGSSENEEVPNVPKVDNSFTMIC